MSSVKSTGSSRLRMPQIKLTRYEVAISVLQTSGMIAVLTFGVMLMIWLSNLLPAPISKKVELMPAGDGGWEDGSADATPNVESPEDAVPDPSMANEETDVTQLEEVQLALRALVGQPAAQGDCGAYVLLEFLDGCDGMHER